MLKKIVITLLLLMIFISTAFPVSASESFSRADVPGNVAETRLSREIYTVSQNITATSLKLEESLTGITDICCDNSGNILLLCGNESRLVRISSDFSTGEEIAIIDDEGNQVDFKGAKGIFCSKDGKLYISDTNNARILITENDGKLLRVLSTPESELIPENFIYQPSSLAIDDQGYTYILSLGCYYGALLYSPEGEFLGFYGANTTQTSALDTLSYLWDKITSTDAKKASSIRKLPYSFVDFDFDAEGYVVTCTGSTDNTNNASLRTNGTGQIKKISHNGANILYKRNLNGDSQSSASVNFLENKLSFEKVQDLVSIAVSEDDYIFALDRTYGLVYMYDSECNLMAAFGGGYGKGEQLGLFKEPVSMTLYGEKVLIADAENCSITVFEPTHYCNLLRKAQNLYIKGDYSEAEEQWQEVLSLNRNCQLAYRGLAMVYYNKGDYELALETAKTAMDYSVYEMAWQQIITKFIANNFAWILLLVLLLIGFIIYIIVFIKKRNKPIIKNQKLKLALSVSFHPFESFRLLKEKQQGSVWISVVITILLYISAVLKVVSSGFLYNTTLIKNYNSLYSLGSTVGLLVLWTVSNWLVCTMFEGKGTLKEVYIGTSYSLIPYVAYAFLKIVLSNFLPLSCAGVLNGIEIALLIYTVFLLAIAMIEIHEYDFFKVFWTTVVIIFFMILIVFIMLMCAILFKQFYSFIGTIYEEIAFR